MSDAAAAGAPAHARRRTRDLLYALALTAALAHLGVIALQRDAGYDLPWHLALGNELLDTHHVPRVDRYSYTFAGRPYAMIPWLFEGAVAAAYRATGGLLGPMLVRLACLLVGFLGLARLLAAWRVGRFTALAGLVIAFELARARFQLRPEIFLVPFLAALLWLIHLAETRRSPVWLAAIVALFALFSNVHPGLTPVLGLVLGCHVAARGLAWAARRRLARVVGAPPARREVARWLLTGAAAAAATGLNPTGYHAFAALHAVSPLWASLITEYAPISFVDSPPLWQAFVVVVPLTVVGGWRPQALPGALASAVLGVMAFRYHRLIGACALVATPVLAISLSELAARIRAHAPGRARVWAGVGALGLTALVALAGWGAYGRDHVVAHLGIAFEPTLYPIRAADFLARNPPRGRLFNDYNFGGYLLWRLGPALPVLIDGRTGMTYDDAFAREISAALERPDAFTELCDRRAITVVVVRQHGLAFHLTRLRGWLVVHFDDVAVVYARDVESERALIGRHAYRHLDPLRPELLLLLAGDPALAEVRAEVERALAQDPGMVTGHCLRAAAAAAAGDEALLRQETAFLATTGVRMDPLLTSAAVALARGRAAEAARLLESSGRDGPIVRLLRGRALMDAGRGPEAARLLAPVADQPEARLMLADVADASGRPEEARDLRRRFVETVGTDPVYTARVARVTAMLSPATGGEGTP